MATLGLKNVKLLTKEQYDTIAFPAEDELYAINGSGFGFPSSNFEDLALGASGTTYTAPAHGYYVIRKKTSGADQYVELINESGSLATISSRPVSGKTAECYVACKKGDKVYVYYSAGGTLTRFRFVYAEGEE